MSEFDWSAKGPSAFLKDNKFNGVNSRKSEVSSLNLELDIVKPLDRDMGKPRILAMTTRQFTAYQSAILSRREKAKIKGTL